MVMERITGPTMLESLGRRPWRLRSQARLLARLHADLHRLPGLDHLPAPLGEGSSLLHLDLHPGNVILGVKGPVVIDWSSAARGDGLADVADTWLLLAGATPPGSPAFQLLVRAVRRSFLSGFLSHFDRHAVRRHLPAAARRRLRDPNIQPAERARMGGLAGI
jgi:aminoglycoside phosphotransferase (APT) family kinase protein